MSAKEGGFENEDPEKQPLSQKNHFNFAVASNEDSGDAVFSSETLFFRRWGIAPHLSQVSFPKK